MQWSRDIMPNKVLSIRHTYNWQTCTMCSEWKCILRFLLSSCIVHKVTGEEMIDHNRQKNDEYIPLRPFLTKLRLDLSGFFNFFFQILCHLSVLSFTLLTGFSLSFHLRFLSFLLFFLSFLSFLLFSPSVLTLLAHAFIFCSQLAFVLLDFSVQFPDFPLVAALLLLMFPPEVAEVPLQLLLLLQGLSQPQLYEFLCVLQDPPPCSACSPVTPWLVIDQPPLCCWRQRIGLCYIQCAVWLKKPSVSGHKFNYSSNIYTQVDKTSVSNT